MALTMALTNYNGRKSGRRRYLGSVKPLPITSVEEFTKTNAVGSTASTNCLILGSRLKETAHRIAFCFSPV